MRRPLRSVLALAAAVASCGVPAPPAEAPFAPGIRLGALTDGDLREASGLVASLRHPGHYWLHEDSGADAVLVAVAPDGRTRAKLRIPDARNHDWEDIARRADTLFVADIGDNGGRRPEVHVYAVREPAVLADTVAPAVARYRLRYPDGPRDAETFLVDPRTGDWFIVTKREERVRVYRAAAPQAPDTLLTLERVPGTLGFRMATGGDVSPDGAEVVVRTYEQLFHWRRAADESLGATLMRPPARIPYQREPQGEAVGFTLDGAGILTTTERAGRAVQPLLRHARHRPGPR